MEPEEYPALLALEESYWWYRGLRRLVEDEVKRRLRPRRIVRQARRGGPHEGNASNAAPPPAGTTIAAPRRLQILDAGCGTGGMTQRLAGLGKVTGLDWSPLALGLARRRGPLDWTRGSVERLPYRSDTFDVVVSLDVLYHRAVESDRAGLLEFRRCLRPGGTLILNLPSYESLRSSHDAAVHTARRYRRRQLTRLLREAGLVPERITYWNTILFPAMAAVRWLRRNPEPGYGSRQASDLRPLPAPINGVLEGMLGLERAWLRLGDLPFGLSVFSVARKPAGPE